LNPPTVFDDNSFDLIYGISIFTHLSELNNIAWYNELIRIAKKDGIILVTTAGKAFKAKMIKKEAIAFDENKLVVRSNVIEGHRIYAAFHPENHAIQLFESKARILKHIKGEIMDWGIEQDTWILKVN
jgi:ubiquinone/menaquinone biosynthesis C-methylase UbiE